MNKKATNPWQLGDIMASLLLSVLLLFFISLAISSSSDKVDDKTSENLYLMEKNEEFLSYLRAVPEQNQIFMRQNFLPFIDGKKYKVLDFNSKSEYNLDILIENNKRPSVSTFTLSPGNGSNIALIEGSADKIGNILNEKKIYPVGINWSDLNEDFNVLFVGCSSPLPTQTDKIKRWVQSGGRIIFTDHAIEILEKIYGNELPLNISKENKENLPQNHAEISFTDEGKRFNDGNDKKIVSLFWSPTIKIGREQDVKVLAKYKDNKITSKGYKGAFFKLENLGEVYYFSAHLEDNLNNLGEKFIQNLFLPEKDYAKDISISFGDESIHGFEWGGEMRDEKNINFKGHMINYMQKCTSFPCKMGIKIKGSKGKITIKDLQIIKDVNDLTMLSHDATRADIIVDAYYSNDYSKLKNFLQDYVQMNFLIKLGEGFLLEITKMPEQEVLYEEETWEYKGASVIRLIDINLPLMENGEYLKIEVFRSIKGY